MKKLLLLFTALLMFGINLKSQTVGIGASSFTPKTTLEIQSTAAASVIGHGLTITNTTSQALNVSSELWFMNGSRYTGAIKTIGIDGLNARLGLFTYSSTTYGNLLERLSILDNGTIGIGTTSPSNCSVLDITSSTHGLLIPRISLTNTTTQTISGTAVDGVIIYNTNASLAGAGAAGKGLYYWSTTSSKWVNLIDNVSPGSAWMLSGNAGTTVGTDYIGTSDATAFDFRSNGVIRGRVSSDGTWTWGATSTSMSDDLTATVTNATYKWGLNAYNAIAAGGALYGATSGSVNSIYCVQGEYDGNSSSGAAVRGIAFYDWAIGVHGQEVTYSGWAGKFDGDVSYSGALWNASDLRIKKNVKTLNNSLSKLMQIRGVEYDFDTEKFKKYSFDSRHRFGVIAQEIEQIFPTLVADKTISTTNVSKSDSGTDVETMVIKMVNYEGLIPILIEAVKEQQLQIEELKKEIDKLKNSR